jgi:site-specific DNA-methyltransferase (cytosine-N4-specific)
LWNSEIASTNFDSINLTEGSVLKLLPEIPSKTINIIITSPPYCNRYDYTRTYALELAFLGINDSGIKQLRQELLTVL